MRELNYIVNPFTNLISAWARYTATVSMSMFVQYVIITLMLIPVFLKYGMSVFSHVLLYRVVDRKRIRRIYKPRSIEMEPMMKVASNIHNGFSASSYSKSKIPVKLTCIGGNCSKMCLTCVHKGISWSLCIEIID